MSEVFNQDFFNKQPIIGIIRGFEYDKVSQVVSTVINGGLKNIEITLDSPNALQSIKNIKKSIGPSMNVGAGTVCKMEELEAALEAGAQFIVSPITSEPMIVKCKTLGVPIFPGAFSPTEIHRAWELGATMVKLFPANQLGPSYIKNIMAPLSDIKILATGGITPDTLLDYHQAGATGFGVGSSLFNKSKIAKKDWAWLEQETRKFVELCPSLKGTLEK